MKVLVQRSLASSVSINNKIVGKIDKGLVLLVGFTYEDNEEIIDKMNKSLLDTNGSILSISQFTLYANTKKGNRPSYIEALNGNLASPLYDLFNKKLKEQGFIVETGVFGADMKVSITNDGPVTIILESGV